MCLVSHSCPTLCSPIDCSLPGSSVHGDSPGQNTGMSCHALLQGILPTQGSNPGLPHCRWIPYWRNHQESPSGQVRSGQSLSCVRLFSTPWITARQASLSITNSRSSLGLTSIELVMPSSHLILCRPLLLLPPIPPSIRVFSNESILRMRWPKYCCLTWMVKRKDFRLVNVGLF